MSACDVSTFGGGFKSKKNKTSQQIDVSELGGVLTHNVKDNDGKIIESRDYKPGDWVAIVDTLKPGQELTKEFVENNNIDLSRPGPIQAFWTVLDGKQTSVAGAEVKRAFGLRRIPLRKLWPVPAPAKDEQEGEQKNGKESDSGGIAEKPVEHTT
jgi:sulfite reductase alpha subunit-like flavoprotein